MYNTFKNTSQILTDCRIESGESKLTKHVIWNKKAKKSAIPAYNAKAFTAGMSERPPEKLH